MAASSGWAPAVQGMRIAIQGSGISAAAAAERLATKHDVTVFEAGRGPGGRMSTRRAESYQWDHGAQYFTPKTEGFARAVDEWQARGMAKIWEGEHCIWTARDGLAADPKAAAAKRYVGSPAMNALCKGLLEGVQTVYETRAVAKPRAGGTGWTLENQRGQPLGDFDFLICSDKTATMRHRSDLDKRVLGAFTQPASRVQSARGLALMLATTETNMQFASLLLEEHSAFSWVARDDSKPGRGRTDGVECWVAQASPAWTKRFFETHKGTRYANAIRAAVASELAPEFEALVCDITGGAGPDILFAQGHRWGAAFPTDHFDPKVADGFYLDPDAAFAACGDFFSPFPGRVEGGWISGSSLADALLQGLSH